MSGTANRLRAGLLVLLSHWRRNPGQAVTLIIGLSLATALWSGVQAINAEARASYAKAEATLGAQGRSRIVARQGGQLTIKEFVKLQRNGWRTSPLIEGQIRIKGRRITLLGIEPLTAPGQLASLAMANRGNKIGSSDVTTMLGKSGLVFAAPETIDEIGDDPRFPNLEANANIASGIVLTDISVAADLLEFGEKISRLIVIEKPTDMSAQLGKIAPQLEIKVPDKDNGAGRSTDSFHLNLTAFGLLSFAVGLFIVHGTIGLAFEQRRGVFRTLRVLGLSLKELTLAILMELTTFALLAGTLGVVLGYGIAAFLLPDVAATLRGLYGSQVAGDLTLRPEWWATGLLIAVAGTAIASASSLAKLRSMPILAAAQPRAWGLMSRRARTYQLFLATLLFAVSLGLGILGNGLVAAFALLGALLVGAALLLPSLFSVFLSLGQRTANGPIAQWFWADTKQQVPGLSLALMALLLALAANIGVGTMVGSFRTTFVGWLDQRLASEIYVSARDEVQAKRLRAWLETRSDAVLPIWNVKTDILGTQGEMYGVSDHATYRENWPLLDQVPDVWDRVATGELILINEQLARRESLSPSDTLRLPSGQEMEIGGIYSDYGNPSPQIMINTNLLVKFYPNVAKLRFGVRIKPDKVKTLIADLRNAFDLPSTNIVEQSTIKEMSLKVFERTFSITDALNVLTLAVAGFAIFTSLLTLAAMRLPQLAPVWAMGLTRKKLAQLELLRALLLAVLTVVLALPVGLMLAWVLLAVVNVEAFGWRLPMQVFPLDWVKLAALALVAAFLAALIPARRLAKIQPAELVKVFTHER